MLKTKSHEKRTPILFRVVRNGFVCFVVRISRLAITTAAVKLAGIRKRLV
jgi:hypothetical protein